LAIKMRYSRIQHAFFMPDSSDFLDAFAAVTGPTGSAPAKKTEDGAKRLHFLHNTLPNHS
jgi:hypothetical protein